MPSPWVVIFGSAVASLCVACSESGDLAQGGAAPIDAGARGSGGRVGTGGGFGVPKGGAAPGGSGGVASNSDASAGGSSADARPPAPTGWTAPAELPGPDQYPIHSPRVAIDASGAAHVVAVGTNLWDVVFLPDSSWSPPETLSTHSQNSDHALVANAAHAMTLLFGELNGQNFTATARRYVPANGWAAAEPVGTPTTDEIVEPNVTMTSSGDAAALWIESTGSRTSRIVVNRWSASQWTGPVVLDSQALNDFAFPTVALDGAGHAVALWRTNDGTTMTIGKDWMLASYFDGSKWSPNVTVFGSGVQGGYHDLVFVGGTAVALWTELRVDTAYQAYSATFTSGAGWSAPLRVDAPNAGDAYQSVPRLAAGGTTAFGIWTQEITKDDLRLWAASYTEAGGWAAPAPISKAGSAAGTQTDIAANGAGQAVAAWAGKSTNGYGIWVSRYSAASGWSSAELLDDGDTVSSLPEVSVAIDDGGRAVVAWDRAFRSVWASWSVAP